MERTCRYIDDYHLEVGSNLYHICEFAERMEQNGNTVIPLRSSLPEQCYVFVQTENCAGIVKKGESGFYRTDIQGGKPSETNALVNEMNKKLGLSKEVIDEAAKLISEENTRFEDVVDTLQKTRLEMEKEKEKTAEMQNEIDEIKKKAENELSLAKQKGETQILMAQNEAKRILENAKRAAASLMMELDRLKREQSNEKNASEMARKAKAALKQHLNTIDDMTYEKNDFDGDDDDYVLPRPLKTGDNVFVKTLGTEAEVVSLDKNGNAEVKAGVMKMKVKASELRLLAPKKKPKKQSLYRSVKEKSLPSGKSSVDLRGESVEEAIADLDMFIDGVLRSGLNELTIIHGKGTGTLRRAIQQHLKDHPNIKSYRTGVYGEGEEGVTIAELK